MVIFELYKGSHTLVHLPLKISLIDKFDRVGRVLSRIYRLGEKSRVAKGDELAKGVRNCFEMNMH